MECNVDLAAMESGQCLITPELSNTCCMMFFLCLLNLSEPYYGKDFVSPVDQNLNLQFCLLKPILWHCEYIFCIVFIALDYTLKFAIIVKGGQLQF